MPDNEFSVETAMALEIDRLRASNADLLAALQLMVVRLSQFYEFHGPIDKAAFVTARAAIARARGE